MLTERPATPSIRERLLRPEETHVAHLSPAALNIVKGLPQREGRENLFGHRPRPFSGFSKAKAALDKRIASLTDRDPEDWRLHDRRKYADATMRELGVDPWVVEAILNHPAQGVSRHYNFAQYDAARREAFDKLGEHILEVTAHQVSAERHDPCGCAAGVIRLVGELASPITAVPLTAWCPGRTTMQLATHFTSKSRFLAGRTGSSLGPTAYT